MNTPTRQLAFSLLAVSALAMPPRAYGTPTDPSTIATDRVVDQLRIDPHGQVSGVLLRDGTEIVATGAAAQTLATFVRPGDRIRTPIGPSDTLEIEDLRSGRFVQIGGIAEVARGGGPATQASNSEYAPVDDASRLGRIAVRGRVRSMLHLLDGTASGFVMDDGTQVHVLKRVAFAVTEMVSPGDSIVVEGRGTRTPIGTGLWAVKIMRPDHQVMLDITRGIRAPDLRLP